VEESFLAINHWHPCHSSRINLIPSFLYLYSFRHPTIPNPHKKNEAPCGLLFPRDASTPFLLFAPVICLPFQAFPSYPLCRWAELTLN
jgi:hypothetical protein